MALARRGDGLVMPALAAAVFAGAASLRCLDGILAVVASDFHVTVGIAGLAVTSYALSYSLCQLAYGPIADRVGTLRVVACAAAVSTLAAVGCALAPSLELLVAARLLAGGIAAAIGPLAMVWVGAATTPDERPVLVARMTAASIFGAMAGQLGGGLAGQWLGWRATFVAIGALFGLAGAALLTARTAWRGGGVEERPVGAFPSLLRLVGRPPVRAVLAGVAAEGASIYAVLPYVAPALHERLGTGAATSGLVVALFGIGGIGFVLIAPALVRRVGERARAAAGAATAAVACALLLAPTSVATVGSALVLMGSGFLMLHNVLQVRALRMAPGAAGSALSLFACSFFLAQAAGAAFGGWCVDARRFALAPALAAVALLAVACAFARPVLASWRDRRVAGEGAPR